MNLRGNLAIVSFCTSLAPCQSAMDAVFQIRHPPDPPRMALLRVMGMARMATDSSLPVKGLVVLVTYQERNTLRPLDSPPALLRNLYRRQE